MARKSRKNIKPQQESGLLLPENKLPDEDHTLAAAAYARLSVENGGHETDDSIQTQITLIHDYIKSQPDLKLADTYVDNGYTGINFDRPEFERMMRDVCSGKIQCIVVKDLSRFGRDYLETGHYLETIFPRMNVRFIAITDNFDNANPDDVNSLSVPIKNMINNMYAKDISRKVRSSLKTRWQREGGKLFSRPPYGYVLSEDKTAFIPEEGPADNVRIIYHWYLSGVSRGDIAKRLRLLGELSPSLRFKERYGHKVTQYANDWTSSSVDAILKCPSYTGDMVYHRKENLINEGVKSKPVDKKDWVIHKDYNAPIILREDYEAVQNTFAYKAEKSNERYADIDEKDSLIPDYFKGMIYCGCCRNKMYFHNRKHKHCRTKAEYALYTCRSKDIRCPNRNRPIQSKWLQIVVMDQIKVFIKNVWDKKEMVKKALASEGGSSRLAQLKKKAASLAGQIEQTEERNDSLYMDFTEGVLDKDEYQYIKEHYIAQKQKLEQELTEVKQSIHNIEKKADVFIDQADHMEKYADSCEFNEELIHDLIDKIYIDKDNTLEICFKCDDIYQELAKYMEEA